jgi:hypothetical protein
MVVRRFSIAYHWFADDFNLCVALALYLWVYRNVAWLFEHMYFLAEIVG